MRRIIIACLIIVLLGLVAFSVRTWRSLELLESARQTGVPSTSHVRPFMTLEIVGRMYSVSPAQIVAGMNLPAETPPATLLSTLMGNEPSIAFLKRLQTVLAAIAPAVERPPVETGWFGQLAASLLDAIIGFGTAGIAMAQFLAALGLPLPSGLSATVTGALAAQGRIDMVSAILATLPTSFAGDVIGFWLGRGVGISLLDRYGKYVGLSKNRRALALGLFERWGGLTILLSRTYVSSMSSVVNVLAGAGNYPAVRFLAIAALGRTLWACAYLGIGYAVGNDSEAASDFLFNLTRLLMTLLAAVVCFAALKPAARQPSI